MNKLLMFAGAALVATGGVAVAQSAAQPATDPAMSNQAAPGTMTPDNAGANAGASAGAAPMATMPDATAAPAMPDAQTQAAQTPDAGMAPSATMASTPKHYPLCSRSRHDECRNPGGK